MNIYIVGAGGLGGYFGGRLAQKYPDLVTFVDHDKDHFDAIKTHGLYIKSVLGDFQIKPAKILKSISQITKPDWIFFAVKTYDTLQAAKELKGVVLNKTIITTFQNGVLNDLEIKKVINECQVYPGAAYLISLKMKPGVIEHIGGMRKLVFGDRNRKLNPQLYDIEKLLNDAGIESHVSDDITKDIWNKFIFILASSGMTAVCKRTMGEVLQESITRRLYERCVKEAISITKKLNINMQADIFESVMKVSLSTNPESKTSLSNDIEKGERNEIETLNGTILKFAKQYNVDVPINEFIYGVIKLLNK